MDWKKKLALIALTLLAGCSTPGDLMSGIPSRVIETSMKPDAVKDCIVASNPTYYRTASYEGGWKVWEQSTVAYAIWIVNIMPTAGGSHISIYKDDTRATVFGYGTYSHSVAPCLEKLPRV